MRKLLTAFAAITVTVLATNASQAALVQIEGDDLIFEYDDSTLFGTANVVGNTIFFTPTNFKAQSLNGAGIASTDTTLHIDTWVKDGSNFNMAGASLYEEGDYQLIGSNSWVSVGGQLRATSLTQGPFFTSDFIQASGPLDTVGGLTAWSATAAVDFGSVAGWDSDTKVRYTIENVLDASTLELGEKAFIEKKYGGIGVAVTEVPLPGAAWLFGSALLGIAGITRRKSR